MRSHHAQSSPSRAGSCPSPSRPQTSRAFALSAASCAWAGHRLALAQRTGVPVIGYRTGTLPAFYVRDSGFALEQRLDEPDAVVIVVSEDGPVTVMRQGRIHVGA